MNTSALSLSVEMVVDLATRAVDLHHNAPPAERQIHLTEADVVAVVTVARETPARDLVFVHVVRADDHRMHLDAMADVLAVIAPRIGRAPSITTEDIASVRAMAAMMAYLADRPNAAAELLDNPTDRLGHLVEAGVSRGISAAPLIDELRGDGGDELAAEFAKHAAAAEIG